ncbi:MAG: 50S ribosomal protein L24 [Patescibacteria group bacterium]
MIYSLKIKKGDTVQVAKGKDRGKKGRVVRVLPRVGKLLVEGVNQKTRHTRPRRAGEKGQSIIVTHPVVISNVRVVCPSCGKGTRVGYEITDGVKTRICKKCKATLS